MAVSHLKLEYAASAAVGFGSTTLASLASSSTFVAGVESSLIDNTTTKYPDFLLSGHVKAGTTPTVLTEARMYVVAIEDDSVWPDVFDGTNSAETVTSAEILDAIAALAGRAVVNSTTTGRVYAFKPVSVASLFGGVCPAKFVVFIAHNMVAALDSTAGSHVFTVKGVYYSITPQ